MESIFSQDFFINNRQSLRNKHNKDLLMVLIANGSLQKVGDVSYSFSQERNFWYLTGISQPDIILVIDNEQEFLILPERSFYQDTFDGVIDNNRLSEISGIEKIYNYEEGMKILRKKINHTNKIGLVSNKKDYSKVYGFFINPSLGNLLKTILEIKSGIEIIDLRESLAMLRQIKQPIEIEAIKRAIDITEKGILFLKHKLTDYKYEYQVEADLTHFFKYEFNLNHAFDPIIANGLRACVLHNTANDGQLVKGNLITLDVGAEFNYYSADITRTYCLGSKATSFQQDVYSRVENIQQKAISLLKPGIFLHDYEKEVTKYIGKALVELKIIKKISLEAIRLYFPHATSHFLGLEVHDVGDYSKKLEAGMVVTVEPGIYIADRSIGVRIEDDILITKTGTRVLSTINKKMI